MPILMKMPLCPTAKGSLLTAKQQGSEVAYSSFSLSLQHCHSNCGSMDTNPSYKQTDLFTEAAKRSVFYEYQQTNSAF